MLEDARLRLLLSVADDELVIGHRHSEWTGWAPYMEEDLAFSSIAQDEIAHARLLYGLAVGPAGQDEDRLAFGREPPEYLNAVVCERPNGDWAYTAARQYLYDTADQVRLEALAASSWGELADVVRLMQLEERYHLEHARAWLKRLAEGPVAARQRYAEGLEACLVDAVGLFEPIPGEEELVATGVLPRGSEEMLGEWLGRLGETLEAVALDWVLEGGRGRTGEMVPTSSGEIEEGTAYDLAAPGIGRLNGRWAHQGGFAGAGGRRGRHSEDFLPLWEEMTMLYRAHPGARW